MVFLKRPCTETSKISLSDDLGFISFGLQFFSLSSSDVGLFAVVRGDLRAHFVRLRRGRPGMALWLGRVAGGDSAAELCGDLDGQQCLQRCGGDWVEWAKPLVVIAGG